MVLMGDFLIILAFDCRNGNNEVNLLQRTPHLLAVDLRDLNVQQVRVEEWGNNCPMLFDDYGPKCVLHQYNENQLVVFDLTDKFRCSHILTIECLWRKTLLVMTMFDNFSSSFCEM